MNDLEASIKKEYERRGYDVISLGKPDLILLKNGTVSFVEVKGEKDSLSDNQLKAIEKIRKHKIRVTFRGDGALKARRKYLDHKYGWHHARMKISQKMIVENTRKLRAKRESKRILDKAITLWY